MTDFRALCAELTDALNNLHALVWGECPRLLDEDRGGSGFLDLEIEETLTTARAALAEQPVCKAYYSTNDDLAGPALAAALRAVADQVVPEEPLYGGDQRWEWERDARQSSRKKMLAIADELEAQ